MYSIEFKTKVLLEDGKVYVSNREVQDLEQRLDEMKIKYYVIPLGTGMTLFELEIRC